MKKWSLANRRLRIVWAPKSRGRGPLDKYVINLIIELKTNNPKWGALKISNELAKIGISVCKKTVAKYLEMYGLNSPKNNSKLSWLQFLNSYNFKIAIDFTSIISLSGKQLYILSIINLSTRELLFIMPLIQ